MIRLIQVGNSVFNLHNGSTHLGGFQLCRDKSDPTIASIWSFSIFQEHRGKKYAQLMLKLGLQKAKQIGIKQVWLKVQERNESALHIYKKLGFVPVSKEWPNTFTMSKCI